MLPTAFTSNRNFRPRAQDARIWTDMSVHKVLNENIQFRIDFK